MTHTWRDNITLVPWLTEIVILSETVSREQTTWYKCNSIATNAIAHLYYQIHLIHTWRDTELGKPHCRRRHLGIARIAFAPPPHSNGHSAALFASIVSATIDATGHPGKRLDPPSPLRAMPKCLLPQFKWGFPYFHLATISREPTTWSKSICKIKYFPTMLKEAMRAKY